MMWAASSRRTRSRHGRGVSPTVSASLAMVVRPLRCSAARILTSMRSNAGARRTVMDVAKPARLFGSGRHEKIRRGRDELLHPGLGIVAAHVLEPQAVDAR